MLIINISIKIDNLSEINLSEIDFDNVKNHYHIDNILSINLKSFTTLNHYLKANETFSNDNDFSLRDLYIDDLLKIFNEVGYSLKTFIGEPI
jgi:preprotein translocase subunit SecA